MTDTMRNRIADAIAAAGEQPDADVLSMADAILALPGIAVVELPEPDYDGDDGDGGFGWGTGDNSVFASGGMVYDQYCEFSSAEAREIGLWWIAAAEHAEKETK